MSAHFIMKDLHEALIEYCKYKVMQPDYYDEWMFAMNCQI